MAIEYHAPPPSLSTLAIQMNDRKRKETGECTRQRRSGIEQRHARMDLMATVERGQIQECAWDQATCNARPRMGMQGMQGKQWEWE